MKTSIVAQKKPDTTKFFKRSFQAKPSLESQLPLNDPKRVKTTSTSTSSTFLKPQNLLRKVPEERRPKNIFELNKHSYPKSVLNIQANKENFWNNNKKTERIEKSAKLCPKIIENDDSLQPCDEDVPDKSAPVEKHRFSDIYKPSKFLENKNKADDNNLEPTPRNNYQAGASSHIRTKSLEGASNVPDVNYDIGKIAYTEECRDEPIYLLTEGFENLMKDREYEDFCNVLERTTFEEEKKWGFQRQYKLQKSYVERKDGDSGAPSTQASSTKKNTFSRLGLGLSQDQRSKGLPTPLHGKTSGIKSTVKNLNSVLSPFEKSGGSKLDGSLTLTMSSTSEGIMYRSAYTNMANLNSNHFQKFTQPHKGSLIEPLLSKKIMDVQAKSQNHVTARESKRTQFQSQKLQKENILVEEDGRQRGSDRLDGRFIKNSRPSSRMEVNFQTDLSLMEQEPFNAGAILDNSTLNKSTAGLLSNPLALYCDEQLDMPSGIVMKTSYGEEEDHLKVMVPKKLSFEPSTEVQEEPGRKLKFEDEIKLWEKKLNNAQDICGEIYENMLLTEYNCQPDAFYFSTKQTEVTPLMRAILLDWMAEVSGEFCMKRGTFYAAVSYVDRFLSIVPDVQKDRLQLLGTTALFIAFKMEETEPVRIKDFTRATDDTYTLDQLKDMELQVCQALKWKLQSNNLFAWANWYMHQWDIFLQLVHSSKFPCIANRQNVKNGIFFKQAADQSYAAFREVMQILDLLLMDSETLQYNQRVLVASVLYMVVGKHYQQFNLNMITTEFSRSSVFLAPDFEEFNTFFSGFLRDTFGFELQDLFPTIQYAAPYFSVKISQEMPFAAKKLAKNIHNGHYEEFLSYQTHAGENLSTVKTIIRRKMQ